jgi:hypothetical protein
LEEHAVSIFRIEEYDARINKASNKVKEAQRIEIKTYLLPFTLSELYFLSSLYYNMHHLYPRGSVFYCEDGSSRFFRNVDNYPRLHSVTYHNAVILREFLDYLNNYRTVKVGSEPWTS